MRKEALFLGLILVLSLICGVEGCIQENAVSINASTIANNTVDQTKTETSLEEKYAGLYKEPISFEGYHYCDFVFDPEYETYAKEMEYEFVKFCNLSEKYPLINDFLYNEYSVKIEQENWQVAAAYAGQGQIIINKQFMRAKNLDIYIVHEIAHSATETLNLPTWLNEGIAEYSAYHFFGTESKLSWYGFEGFEKWNPSTATYGDNIKGYTHSGYIIKSFVKKYGDESFKALLRDLYGKIDYDDNIDIKNQKVLAAFRDILKNESLSLTDITCRYSSDSCFV
jgi:hypothetical protein